MLCSGELKKDMMSKIWANGDTISDLAENIVGREEIAHYENVFNSCLLLMRQNEYLLRKGLRDTFNISLVILWYPLHLSLLCLSFFISTFHNILSKPQAAFLIMVLLFKNSKPNFDAPKNNSLLLVPACCASIYKYQPISTKLGQNFYDHKISDELDYGSNRTRTSGVICP